MDPSSPSPRTTTGSPARRAATDAIVVGLARHELIESLGRLYLPAHPDGSERDWRRCGTTCPEIQCIAISQAASDWDTRIRCPKKASVEVRVPLLGGGALPLCGGHFTVHRSGKDLELDRMQRQL